MAAYIGNFNLWLTLGFAIFQFINSIRKNNKLVISLNKLATTSLLFCSLTSFLSLMYSHVISDFSLINVFQNSHTTKPLIYKIAGVWGNHEGSMLLWILVLAIFNFFIFKLYKKTNLQFVSKILETQALVLIGFVLFTVLTSNPFERMQEIEINGMGFNPILQDPALAIHPPLLYIGYVGFSAAFSISVAVLSLENNQLVQWHKYMKPFVLAAWTFLTAGIAFGSLWAYYELGWGGWWFWDPVENASLMPWLLGTALIHSLITVEKKNLLKSWVLLLSILAFLLSVIGTFLVRSGILTSVHTFASDPSRGIYILLFATLLGAYSLFLFGIKLKKDPNNNYLSFLSKENSILINNILMVVVCFSVSLGTIYPLIIEAFTSNKISVGEPYYNTAVVPIMIPAILIMGIGPILAWGKVNKLEIFKKTYPCFIASLTMTILTFIFYQSFSFGGVIGIFLAYWIIFNNTILWFRKKEKLSRGMLISHLGIGFLILGIVGSSIWQKEKIIKMSLNNEVQVENYNIFLKEINELKGPNYLAIQGNFLVYHKNKMIAGLKPENRYYPVTNNFTTEVSIHSTILRDLYIVLGSGNKSDGWTVRIYYNPLVMWIWIGAIIIFLGGIVSININLRKLKY